MSKDKKIVLFGSAEYLFLEKQQKQLNGQINSIAQNIKEVPTVHKKSKKPKKDK